MAGLRVKNIDIINRVAQKKVLGSSLRILIPLYTTYIVFLLSIFLIFIPQQKKQLLDQKKEAIHQLTDSVLSLLQEFDLRIKNGEITEEAARKEAIGHIRILRYGPEGKDYFWINDMHPFMIMHPFRPDLEGRDLTLFKDAAGNYPFIAMVETVMSSEGGYVGYHWQWKDNPQKKGPKISYVEQFAPWGWVVGTGIYVEDIDREIQLIRQRILNIFGGILIFIIILSLYIAKQVIQVEQKKNLAEDARALEELRLKTLLKLSQMTNESMKILTEFAWLFAGHLQQIRPLAGSCRPGQPQGRT